MSILFPYVAVHHISVVQGYFSQNFHYHITTFRPSMYTVIFTIDKPVVKC